MKLNFKKKIAFIATHPIQYYSPIYKGLSRYDNYEIKVFYTWGNSSIHKFEREFNKDVKWDIPLLDGYNYEFCTNISKDKGTHHFNGINAIDLNEKVEAYNPDLVCIIGWNYKSHLEFINKYSGIYKIALRGDSHLLDKTNFIKQWIKDIYISRVFKKIDYFFYVGTNNKEYFRHYGAKDNQLYYINHSIENHRFSNLDIDNVNELKSKYTIKDCDRVFLFVGKLEEKKGVKLLIDAFSSLNQDDVKLIIVGDGSERKHIYASKNKNIIFAGFINQKSIPNYYKLAQVLVIPSIGPNETWGLVINEAMANGLAIIASDKVGAAKDLISGNGIIVPANDRQSLFNAMRDIFEYSIQDMSMRSLDIIKDHTLNKSIERYLETFNSILFEKNIS